MVAYPTKEQVVPRMIEGVVCPSCFKPAMYPAVLAAIRDGYTRELRQYFGGCMECKHGFAVYQFRKDEKWYIHKYQLYDLPGDEGAHSKAGAWQVINPMPEPAPIVLGPGGDYRKPIELDATNQIKQCIDIIRKVAEAMGGLLNIRTHKENG